MPDRKIASRTPIFLCRIMTKSTVNEGNVASSKASQTPTGDLLLLHRLPKYHHHNRLGITMNSRRNNKHNCHVLQLKHPSSAACNNNPFDTFPPHLQA